MHMFDEDVYKLTDKGESLLMLIVGYDCRFC